MEKIQGTFDDAKAGAFTERFLGVLNDAALCLMVSIGHRTGLFDALAKLNPSTSGEIAHATGLNERYVREWLSAMQMMLEQEWTIPLGSVFHFRHGGDWFRKFNFHRVL